jgi:hypothetical protein
MIRRIMIWDMDKPPTLEELANGSKSRDGRGGIKEDGRNRDETSNAEDSDGGQAARRPATGIGRAAKTA